MKINYLVTIAILALACAIGAGVATANLVSTSFGFPVIVQNGSTSAFNQATSTASDFENINIDFPVSDVLSSDGVTNNLDLGPTVVTGDDGTVTSNVLPFGPVNLAFPSISQTVDQAQAVTQTSFSQTNEFAEFSYPFESVGDVSLPSFGFGF